MYIWMKKNKKNHLLAGRDNVILQNKKYIFGKIFLFLQPPFRAIFTNEASFAVMIA